MPLLLANLRAWLVHCCAGMATAGAMAAGPTAGVTATRVAAVGVRDVGVTTGVTGAGRAGEEVFEATVAFGKTELLELATAGTMGGTTLDFAALAGEDADYKKKRNRNRKISIVMYKNNETYCNVTLHRCLHI